MTKIKHMAYSIAMLAMLALALGAPAHGVDRGQARTVGAADGVEHR